MKKYLKKQQGLTLIELVIAMTITLILLSGLSSVLSVSLTTWRLEKSRMAMVQTARMAVDRVMREVCYAQQLTVSNPRSLTITKIDGEINTFELGGGLHGNTLYMIIDKTASGGGIATSPLTENNVTELHFTPFSQYGTQAIIMTLIVKDKNTGVEQELHTAGYPWNQL